MRSQYGDLFNHDEEAESYDSDVGNSLNPIRVGYQDVLRWIIEESGLTSYSRVLELGPGTGNLTRLIPECRELICVDLSEKMERIAQAKIFNLNRRFIQCDILEVFDRLEGPFDCILSSYTIHHLTEQEKILLFSLIYRGLNPGGRAVFGDLMLQNGNEKTARIQQYLSAGDRSTAQAIEEEFFWDVESARREMSALGFQVKIQRLTDLSYGIAALKIGFGDRWNEHEMRPGVQND